jgi:hypothetical protein
MTLPPALRIWARCRGRFPADNEDDADPPAKWWLCGPCRLAFFGAHPRRGPLTESTSTD